MMRNPSKHFANKQITKEGIIEYIVKGRAPSTKSFDELMKIAEPLFEKDEESYECSIDQFKLGNNIHDAVKFATILCSNVFDETNLSLLYNLKVAETKKDDVKYLIIGGIVIVITAGGIIAKCVYDSKKKDGGSDDINDDIYYDEIFDDECEPTVILNESDLDVSNEHLMSSING